MKNAFLYAGLLALLASVPCWPYGAYPHDPIFQKGWGLQIYSPAFLENGWIPDKYTCDGRNVSPPLHIRGVSSKSRSLVLIMEDPDARRGDWVHWTVWNMSPGTRVIPENSVPEGSVEGDTDFGMPAWSGPCPRLGVHRYQFNLYALDARLELPARAAKADLDKAMQGHVLDHAVLVGFFGRNPARAATDTWIRRKFTN